MKRTVAMCLLAVFLSGCGADRGDTPDLANVHGIVTLDGVPLAGAQVEFQPVAGGRPSVGTTSADGRYTLTYSNDFSGAKLGEHKVAITTFSYAQPDQPEKLPARYHSATTLTATVTEKNPSIDFKLESK